MINDSIDKKYLFYGYDIEKLKKSGRLRHQGVIIRKISMEIFPWNVEIKHILTSLIIFL